MAASLKFNAVKSLGLRFQRNCDETAFKASLEVPLARGGSIGCFALICSLALNIPSYVVARNRADYPFQWDANDPRTQYYSVRAIQALVVCAAFVIYYLRLRSRWFMGLNLEVMSVCSVGFAIISTSLSSSWHVAIQFGMDPDHVWGLDVRSSEFLVVLVMDLLMIAVCLYLPIRACLLWILELTAIVSFAVMVLACGSPFPHSVPQCLLLHAMLCAFSFAGAHRNEKIAREKWKAQRQIGEQQAELDKREKATTHLLDSFCDCVVHLGPSPDFFLLEPNPRLAALLLHTDIQALEGRKICDFMVFEDEYDRLVQKMQGEPNVYGLGAIMNVHLKDNTGRAFAVTAACAAFRSSDVATHYLLGFNETQERLASAGPKHSIGSDYHIIPVQEDVSLRSSGINSDPNSDSSDGLFSSFSNANLEELSVTIDISSQSLTILKCSAAFMRMCGSNVMGRSFGAWFKDPQDALIFFQEAGNALAAHHEDVIGTSLGFSPFEGIHYSCKNCTLTLDEEEFDDGIPLTIVFQFLKQRTRSKKEHQKEQRRKNSDGRYSSSSTSGPGPLAEMIGRISF